jgi:hypothetical protein
MKDIVREKMTKILLGELTYTTSNLALNMLITKMQKKILDDPSNMNACMEEIEQFAAKSPIIAKVDFSNIAKL